MLFLMALLNNLVEKHGFVTLTHGNYIYLCKFKIDVN